MKRALTLGLCLLPVIFAGCGLTNGSGFRWPGRAPVQTEPDFEEFDMSAAMNEDFEE